MIRIGSLILVTLFFFKSQAQEINAYVVFFKTKSISEKEVSLAQKAKDRRIKYNIAIDQLDYPVDKDYVKAIQSEDVVVRYTLRWHNAAVVESSLDNLDFLSALPFIKGIEYVGKTAPVNAPESPGFRNSYVSVKNSSIKTNGLTATDYGVSYLQNAQIGATYLHNVGFDGKGVTIAVLDAGFKSLDRIEAFIKLQGNRQLTIGYDVVDLDNVLTDADNHGTAVSSCIASYDKEKYIGSAPNASIVLFRTEKGATEYPLEELNWCKAAELADSMGVDMITSSLGYTQFDDTTLSHKHENLNGEQTYVSLGARTAVQKGIVVLNSAGNEGDGKWLKIGTPADVASVLTIGAVDINDDIGNFSSRGHNAKGDIKPDVCGLGVFANVASPSGAYYQGFGTSYATPIVAGGVACLMQAHPDKNPKEINDAIRKSALTNQKPDSVFGYGVARVDIAHQLLKLDGDSKPRFLYGSRGLAIYNNGYEQIEYKVYSVKPFLIFFKRKTEELSGSVLNQNPVTHLPIEYSALDCSKKYTLEIELTSGVEKYDLKKKDLYRCPN